MGSTWEQIMVHSPTMKRLIEEKIVAETAALRAENEQLKEELTATQLAVAELAESMLGGA